MIKLRENDENRGIISESTPIRVGLIIALLTVFGSSIWWASSISSKLDAIVAYQNTTQSTFSELKAKNIDIDKDISDIKLKLALSDVAIKNLQTKPSK